VYEIQSYSATLADLKELTRKGKFAFSRPQLVLKLLFRFRDVMSDMIADTTCVRFSFRSVCAQRTIVTGLSNGQIVVRRIVGEGEEDEEYDDLEAALNTDSSTGLVSGTQSRIVWKLDACPSPILNIDLSKIYRRRSLRGHLSIFRRVHEKIPTIQFLRASDASGVMVYLDIASGNLISKQEHYDSVQRSAYDDLQVPIAPQEAWSLMDAAEQRERALFEQRQKRESTILAEAGLRVSVSPLPKLHQRSSVNISNSSSPTARRGSCLARRHSTLMKSISNQKRESLGIGMIMSGNRRNSSVHHRRSTTLSRVSQVYGIWYSTTCPDALIHIEDVDFGRKNTLYRVSRMTFQDGLLATSSCSTSDGQIVVVSAPSGSIRVFSKHFTPYVKRLRAKIHCGSISAMRFGIAASDNSTQMTAGWRRLRQRLNRLRKLRGNKNDKGGAGGWHLLTACGSDSCVVQWNVRQVKRISPANMNEDINFVKEYKDLVAVSCVKKKQQHIVSAFFPHSRRDEMMTSIVTLQPVEMRAPRGDNAHYDANGRVVYSIDDAILVHDPQHHGQRVLLKACCGTGCFAMDETRQLIAVHDENEGMHVIRVFSMQTFSELCCLPIHRVCSHNVISLCFSLHSDACSNVEYKEGSKKEESPMYIAALSSDRLNTISVWRRNGANWLSGGHLVSWSDSTHSDHAMANVSLTRSNVMFTPWSDRNLLSVVKKSVTFWHLEGSMLVPHHIDMSEIESPTSNILLLPETSYVTCVGVLGFRVLMGTSCGKILTWTRRTELGAGLEDDEVEHSSLLQEDGERMFQLTETSSPKSIKSSSPKSYSPPHGLGFTPSSSKKRFLGFSPGERPPGFGGDGDGVKRPPGFDGGDSKRPPGFGDNEDDDDDDDDDTGGHSKGPPGFGDKIKGSDRPPGFGINEDIPLGLDMMSFNDNDDNDTRKQTITRPKKSPGRVRQSFALPPGMGVLMEEKDEDEESVELKLPKGLLNIEEKTSPPEGLNMLNEEDKEEEEEKYGFGLDSEDERTLARLGPVDSKKCREAFVTMKKNREDILVHLCFRKWKEIHPDMVQWHGRRVAFSSCDAALPRLRSCIQATASHSHALWSLDTCTEGFLTSDTDGKIKMWSVDMTVLKVYDAKDTFKSIDSGYHISNYVTSVRRSMCGRKLLAQFHTGYIAELYLDTQGTSSAIRAHCDWSKKVIAIDPHPIDRDVVLVAFGGMNKSRVSVWNTLENVETRSTQFDIDITSVRWAPQGKWFVVTFEEDHVLPAGLSHFIKNRAKSSTDREGSWTIVRADTMQNEIASPIHIDAPSSAVQISFDENFVALLDTKHHLHVYEVSSSKSFRVHLNGNFDVKAEIAKALRVQQEFTHVYTFDFTPQGDSLRFFLGNCDTFDKCEWLSRQRVCLDMKSMAFCVVEASTRSKCQEWIGRWTNLYVETPSKSTERMMFVNSPYRDMSGRILITEPPSSSCGLSLRSMIAAVPHQICNNATDRPVLFSTSDIHIAKFNQDGSRLYTVSSKNAATVYQWRIRSIGPKPELYTELRELEESGVSSSGGSSSSSSSKEEDTKSSLFHRSHIRVSEVKTSIVFGTDVDPIRF